MQCRGNAELCRPAVNLQLGMRARRHEARPQNANDHETRARVHPASPMDRGRPGSGALRLDTALSRIWEPRRRSARRAEFISDLLVKRGRQSECSIPTESLCSLLGVLLARHWGLSAAI